jgi:hypothetical protein
MAAIATIRRGWNELSRQRKVLLVVTMVLAVVQVSALVGWALLDPNFTLKETFIDLAPYVIAAQAVQARAPLYMLTPWPANHVEFYLYHPLFALAFTLISGLPLRWLAVLGILVQVGCYAASWWVWHDVFDELGLDRAGHALVVWLPLVIANSDWYANLYYWNITATLFLLSALLCRALVRERAWAAVLFALPIAFTKPFWLFPLIVPLVLRRWRFLAWVLAGLAGGYIILSLLYVLSVGPAYGLQSLRDYFTFLTSAGRLYPWEGQGLLFILPNHSWPQILYHYFGFQPWVPAAALAIRGVMIASVLAALVQAWRRRVALATHPQVVLLFVCLGYLTAMALLDELWEVFAGILVFVVLQSAQYRSVRRIALLFVVYALYEALALLGFAAGLRIVVTHQLIPIVMLALLVLAAGAQVWLWRELTVPAS